VFGPGADCGQDAADHVAMGGRGYMTAAVKPVARVALALSGIDRVAIRPRRRNAASAARSRRAP
jgi:hypothetical protein